MNLNEENLKGNIQITSQAPVQKTPLREVSYAENTFKDEFDKMLAGTLNDPSMLVQSIGLVEQMPIEQIFDIGETFNFDTDTIENVDAMFFLNAASKGNEVNLKIGGDTSVIDASNYKTMEVSKMLGDMLARASESNKSLRLDFDNNVTVVLKVSKEGKIDATFFPQDRQVENYLRNNIDYLKVRFDEQNIAYSNISYKPYKQSRQQNRQNSKGDKQ